MFNIYHYNFLHFLPPSAAIRHSKALSLQRILKTFNTTTIMRLLLQPTIASLQNEYDPNDFMDEEQFDDEILVRQGFESEEMEVEDGEEFEIPEGIRAFVITEDDDEEEDLAYDEGETEEYKMYVEIDDGVWEEETFEDLQPGLYELDGHLVKVIRLYDEE